MNAIEEQLWSYIDGTCTPAEKEAIAKRIATDDEYRKTYNELLTFDAELGHLELDEPPMAFNYKVMEGIRTELASQPLKAAINKKIIWAIAAFFIVTILALVAVAFGTINWTSANAGIEIPKQLNTTHINSFFEGPFVKGFLFFDVVLGLFLLDSYLRKHVKLKTH